jgi:RNA polymerase sigma-70 factor, ECF subfamily
MSIREITVTELEGSKAGAEAAEQAFHMDEQTFRVFYDNTARPLWSYLSRVSGNAAVADDLVQESYYRFLRADLKSSDPAYQKNYLFRIATNLAHDHWRALPRRERLEGQLERTLSESAPSDDRTAEHVQQRSDLGRALAQLKPRERELLWLAYVEGSSHKEIAEVVGLREGSIRLLLFRARRKLADVVRKGGTSVPPQGAFQPSPPAPLPQGEGGSRSGGEGPGGPKGPAL